jgi:hypothetical protein
MDIELEGETPSEVYQNIDEWLENNPLEVKYQEGLPPDFNDTLEFLDTEEDRITGLKAYGSTKEGDLVQLKTEKNGELEAVVRLLEEAESWRICTVKLREEDFSGRADAYERAIIEAFNPENVLSYSVS